MDVFSISTDSFSIRIFSRIFSLISLTSIVLITRHFLLSRLKINKKFTYLILALILIFSFPWYSISRPDVLLMLLLTLAIIQINSIIDNPRIRNILLLSFIFALSIFVKQTALFYTIFFLIGLLVIKEFKSSGMLLLLTGVFCIIIYFLIDLLGYDLQFYRLNVLKGVDNGLSLSRALEMSYSVYFSYYLTFTSLLIISCSMVFQKLKNDKLGLFLISINILFFISSTIFALKVGSTINYYNESLIFQLILSALIFEHLSISQKSFSKIFLLITVIQISLIHIVAYRARILRAVIIQDYSK
ncbi:MAG: glycosyltransferase family 39 protein [Saprospiraceae bacterium]|nr:glycosyltransferase family 39 protein [Candidatus Brachybacter algidus]